MVVPTAAMVPLVRTRRVQTVRQVVPVVVDTVATGEVVLPQERPILVEVAVVEAPVKAVRTTDKLAAQAS